MKELDIEEVASLLQLPERLEEVKSINFNSVRVFSNDGGEVDLDVGAEVVEGNRDQVDVGLGDFVEDDDIYIEGEWN